MPKSATSRIVAVISDIHFDLHHEPTWRAFRAWHKEVKPWRTVILGDFVDLGMMSRYVQEPDAPLHAIPQIQCFVREANALAKECGSLVIVEGNHDERWARILMGVAPHVLNGAVGLSLKDQCIGQGLTRSVEWIRESNKCLGYRVGQFLLRHGHRQSGRFGGGKHLAANALAKSMGQSVIFGHFHQGQLFCQTAQGRTAIAIANPSMTVNHDYAQDPSWQRGFSIVEVFDTGKQLHAQAYPLIVEGGIFAWGGKVYDGRDHSRSESVVKTARATKAPQTKTAKAKVQRK